MTERERIHVTDQSTAAEAVTALLRSARHRVDILSPTLDPLLYDTKDCVDALRSLITSAGRHAQVRILVADAGALVGRGHRLLELSRKLSTFMEIRRLSEEDRQEDIAMLLVDGESYLYWGPGNGYMGNGQWHSHGNCRRPAQRFQDAWDRSVADPALRRLHL